MQTKTRIVHKNSSQEERNQNVRHVGYQNKANS